jgi:hypothetical protein
MNKDYAQKTLLKIVETWDIKEVPEYRGFRCANCQEYKNEAWYHWVNSGGFRLPIHLCNDSCNLAFQNNLIQIDDSKKKIFDKNTFGNSYSYTPEAITKFQEIVEFWPEYKEPELKVFTCDLCVKDLDIDEKDGVRKGFHVWWSMVDKTLAELHFHKECASSMGIPE